MPDRRRRIVTAATAALTVATLAACASPSAGTATDPSADGTSASALGTSGTATSGGSSPSAAESPVSSPASPTTAEPAPGRYVDLAAYRADKAGFHEGDVVLFFNATWCPTCQEATRNLTDDPKALGPGLTVVSVDYDENTDLRQRYGVTYQHTFVQVDADGAELRKWSGSSTPREIADKVG